MKHIFLLSTWICFAFLGTNAQTNLIELTPSMEYENINVNKLYDDSLSTSFVIWIKDSVRPHKHEYHTESLYVVDGTAEMFIGDENITIKPGDFVTIPKNTVHSAKVTSDKALKVISVQAPQFIGNDRVFIE